MPRNIKLEVSFTGNKLGSRFSIIDKTKFEHKHDAIYLGTCLETMCNDNYINKAKQRISKRIKDHNGRGIKCVSQIFKILFQIGDIKIFVLRGVFFSRYVRLKSSFPDEKNISSEI